MAEEITIEQEIAALMDNPAEDPALKTEADVETVAEPVEPAATEKEPEQGEPNSEEPAPKPAGIEPPQGLPAAIKSKWASLDPEVQAALKAREDDVHKMFTRNDGELNLGRKMKEVISPYLATIHSEGGTPETAVKSLLDTAYQLRTAQPMQKAQLVAQIAKTYNVDLSLLGLQEGPNAGADNQVIALQQRIAQMERAYNPDAVISKLRDEMENDNVMKEVKAFANDPANAHYETVREDMAALLQNGRAKDLREAYDKAIWANPDLRSTLLAKETAAKEAKRKSEVEAKKKAATSVTGSAGKSGGSTGAKPELSLEDELRERMDAYSGGL